MNRILVVSSFLFAVISFATLSAQAAETKKPHQKADFLKTVDTNKDGKASKAEFMAAMERKFNSMDVDKSETVSVQELKIYGEKDEEARKRALQAAEQAGYFEKIISKGSFIQLFTDRAEREFDALDTNYDNELSADEVGAQKVKRKNAKAKNQNTSAMSKDEFVAIFIENATRDFLRLDKNRDGKLTESELGGKPKIQRVPRLEQESVLPELPKLSVLIPSPHKPHAADKKAQQQKLIKSFFVGIDANHDGKISNKEKNAVFENLFKRLDTNHDQFVTQDEIIAGRHTPLTEKH